MRPVQIVIDTNVMVSALRSRHGASHRLVAMIGDPRFQVNVSSALLLEYEAKLKEELSRQGRAAELWRVDGFLDALASRSVRRSIYFSFRGEHSHAGDAFIVDLAIASGAPFIVTYNRRHFAGIRRFGKAAIQPLDLLRLIGEVA